MQPLHPNSLFATGADELNPPDPANAAEADKAVPNSFAEWLAQPAATISAESEPEQDIVMDVIADHAAQASVRPNPPSARV